MNKRARNNSEKHSCELHFTSKKEGNLYDNKLASDFSHAIKFLVELYQAQDRSLAS